ncbi:MAG: tetratricopeptide repeat protein, partial [Planctomycetota bacterium]
MKHKRRTYLGLRPVFIKRFLRGSVKCLPYLGNLLDEIIFGVLDDESAKAESQKIHKKLDTIISGQDQEEADFAEILLALHIQTDVNETIKERLKEIEQSLRDDTGPTLPQHFETALERTFDRHKEFYAEFYSYLHTLHEDHEKLSTQQAQDHDQQNEQLMEIRQSLERLEQRFGKAAPPSKTTQISNIPYPSIGDLFKGRDDILATLKAQLPDNKATAITQSIQGLGGIGKTRLAIEFGWWALNNNKYRAVFFVSSETPERLDASLASLANEDVLDLGLKKQQEQIASVMRWLKQSHGWLLIFDNADSEEAAQAVEQKLPQLSNGRVIITSRYTRWSAAVSPQTLDLLEPDKAAEFLLERTAGRRIETDQDQSNASQLAQELGYLPLTLEQAAAYIAHQSMTFADYLEEWAEDKARALRWCDKREMKYPVSAAVTWQRTFAKLSPISRTVLHLAAFLAPEPIPAQMFEKSSHIVNEAIKLLEAKKPKRKSKPKIKTALSELSAYSLITKQQHGFTVHGILQEVIRTGINQNKRRQWIGKALEIVNEFAPTDSDHVHTWPVLDVLRPHAETTAKQADEVQITEPTSRLMSVLGEYLHYKALYHESEDWMKRALAIDEASLGKDHRNVATDLNNLSELYRATNRLKEAEPLMRRALRIDEASLGKDHPDVARDLNNLAQLYKDTNRLKEAEPIYKRAIKIDEASLGKDHPNVATRLNNLAHLYKGTNRFKEAEPMYKRALEIWEKSLGEDHPQVATAMNNLAALYMATNRLKESEPLIQRVVKIFEKSFGEKHPNVATALSNLAQLYQDTNRLKEAEPLMQRALAIDEASLGKEHPKVAIRLNNLAALYQDTNRLKESEPLIQRVVKIFEKSLGENHPNVATALSNLAQLYQDTNRLKEAEPLVERALAIDEASLGKEHPDVARDLNNLAQLYQDTNRLKEAEPLMQRVVKIVEKSLGENHPNVATALNNLAQL